MTQRYLRVTIFDEDDKKLFALDYSLPRLEMEELQPPTERFMQDVFAMSREQDRMERLRRFTKLMSEMISHSFTEYMLKNEK